MEDVVDNNGSTLRLVQNPRRIEEIVGKNIMNGACTTPAIRGIQVVMKFATVHFYTACQLKDLYNIIEHNLYIIEFVIS